ncbi:hypothetical protein KCU67_g6102, partial [Aureobasidium melanogenum]
MTSDELIQVQKYNKIMKTMGKRFKEDMTLWDPETFVKLVTGKAFDGAPWIREENSEIEDMPRDWSWACWSMFMYVRLQRMRIVCNRHGITIDTSQSLFAVFIFQLCTDDPNYRKLQKQDFEKICNDLNMVTSKTPFTKKARLQGRDPDDLKADQAEWRDGIPVSVTDMHSAKAALQSTQTSSSPSPMLMHLPLFATAQDQAFLDKLSSERFDEAVAYLEEQQHIIRTHSSGFPVITGSIEPRSRRVEGAMSNEKDFVIMWAADNCGYDVVDIDDYLIADCGPVDQYGGPYPYDAGLGDYDLQRALPTYQFGATFGEHACTLKLALGLAEAACMQLTFDSPAKYGFFMEQIS